MIFKNKETHPLTTKKCTLSTTGRSPGFRLSTCRAFPEYDFPVASSSFRYLSQ